MKFTKWLGVASILFAVPVQAAPPRARAARSVAIPGAQDLGATASSKPMTIAAWLKPVGGDALDKTVAAQQDSSSSSFQRWSDPAALDASLAPSAANVKSVSSDLAARGLKVTGVGPNNLFVKATGTAAQVAAAFGTQLHDYRLGSTSFTANTVKPRLPAGIAYVGGLSDVRPHPDIARSSLPGGPARAALSANPNGLVFSAGCFRAPQAVHFSSADVNAVYVGNRYGADITNSAPGTIASCGYSAADVADAYNLDKLFRVGLDGTGTTVAIVDAFGSTTIQADIDAYSQAMGLPPADLTIIGTPTESPFSGSPNSGWAVETTLDVEWVHSIAPGAKIVLVVTEDNSNENLFGGIVTASNTPGVVAISNSWSSLEIFTIPEERQFFDGILKAVAAKGIGVAFSTGDDGDSVQILGAANAAWPPTSPFVTAVGGVSLAVRQNGEIAFQTAWGNNLTQLTEAAVNGTAPLDPVSNIGFIGGGGGGISDVYFKPSWQRHVPGSRRQIPDISWLADSATGVEIIFTGDSAGDQFIEVVGGTSLSTPMFSALWAIATQRAGHKLGQAAPYLYSLPGSAITDIGGLSSPLNVFGDIRDAGGDSPEIASDLASPLQNQSDFYSALFNSPNDGSWFVITFGTDSTLSVGNGFDIATGLGTPNPLDFVNAFAHRH